MLFYFHTFAPPRFHASHYLSSTLRTVLIIVLAHFAYLPALAQHCHPTKHSELDIVNYLEQTFNVKFTTNNRIVVFKTGKRSSMTFSPLYVPPSIVFTWNISTFETILSQRSSSLYWCAKRLKAWKYVRYSMVSAIVPIIVHSELATSTAFVHAV